LKAEAAVSGFGASDTDIILLIVNRHGMTKLTEDKFTLGAGAAKRK
jgi:hypothetical protein